jgi:molecular chaperone DnaK
MAGDNRTLGRFHLVGIPPAPRGIPQIEVTFDIDANGILHVSAKDRGTGQEQNIQITSSSGLSNTEIDQMVNEAQSHATDDSKKRAEIETRNKLDGLIYATGKLVTENREKLAGTDLSEAERALEDAKKALEEGPADRMERAYERLTQASHQIAAALYKASSAGSGGAGAGSDAGPASQPGGAQDEVVDAEYVDVDADQRS